MMCEVESDMTSREDYLILTFAQRMWLPCLGFGTLDDARNTMHDKCSA